MTAYCVLEPAFFAVPPVVNDRDKIFEWLSALRSFRDVARDPACARYLLAPAALLETLTNANRRASVPLIDQMLEENDLSHVYSAGDILQSIQSMLSRLRPVDQLFEGVALAEIEQCEPACASSTVSLLGKSLNDTLSVLCGLICASPAHEFFVAVLPVDNSSMRIAGKLLENVVDPNTGDHATSLRDFEHDVSLVHGWAEFLTQLHAYGVWQTASDAVDLAFAMTAEMVRAQATPTQIAFGPKFIETLRRNGAWGSGPFSAAVYGVCLSIALDDGAVQLASFHGGGRKKKGVQSSKAGGYLAWRAHVTGKGPGLRLMIWKNGTCLEFSRLGPKSELQID